MRVYTSISKPFFPCCPDCRQSGATFFFLAAPACIKAARWWQCCYGQKWNPSCSVRISTTVQHSVMQRCSAQRDAASSSLWMLGENELSWVKSEGSCSVYIFISQRWCTDVLNVDAAERKKTKPLEMVFIVEILWSVSCWLPFGDMQITYCIIINGLEIYVRRFVSSDGSCVTVETWTLNTVLDLNYLSGLRPTV